MHSWNLSPHQAITLQKELAARVIREGTPIIQTIAGADMALNTEKNCGIAGVIVYEYPSLKEVERVWATAPLEFPYIPGLLSFREGPVLIKAFEKLKNFPDLIMFDGQGIAHPRRLGIASHMGLILDLPTIGCGKSLLCGDYEEPAPEKGSHSLLTDMEETIGAVLRTRTRVKPIFVSIGHKIDLPTTLQITLHCCTGFRIPKPTRNADQFVAIVKQKKTLLP